MMMVSHGGGLDSFMKRVFWKESFRVSDTSSVMTPLSSQTINAGWMAWNEECEAA